MKLIYDRNEPIRIDKYLAAINHPDLYSRSFIDKLISERQITVNSETVKKSYLLEKNDQIELTIPPPRDRDIEGEAIPLDIVYEDEYLAVINKKAGISVHPAPGQYSGTVANAIINRFGKNLPFLDNPSRPGIVHRLDKNTSGLLIVAKDDRTLSRLSRAFSERKIEKRYKAVIYGIPQNLEGTISTMISRHKKERIKMSVSSVGREAVTKYRVLKTFEFFSLIDIKPITGRTHQIRVHFDHLNNPIAGDTVYGKKKGLYLLPVNLRSMITAYFEKKLPRHALHAYKLSFEHPVSGELLNQVIDLPKDMIQFISWLESRFENYELDWKEPL
jgi:23S rRNA pseudouridine1911/1915/1917 synthase